MVVLEVDDSRRHSGTDYEYTADVIMYAKDGVREEIEYDIMDASWKSVSPSTSIFPEDAAKDFTDDYLEQAERDL